MRQLRQHDLQDIGDIAQSGSAGLYANSPRARQWLAAVQGSAELTPVAKVIATVIVCQEATEQGASRWCLPRFCDDLAMDMREVVGALADLTYGGWLDCRNGRWILRNGSGRYHGIPE